MARFVFRKFQRSYWKKSFSICTTRLVLYVYAVNGVLISIQVRYTNSSQRFPNFDIAPELSLELLMAANYLDC